MGVLCAYKGWTVCTAKKLSEQESCECFEMSTMEQRCFYQLAGGNHCDCYRAQQLALTALGKEGEQ